MKILFDQKFPEIKMGAGVLKSENGIDFFFYPTVKLKEDLHVVPYREEVKFLEQMGAKVTLDEESKISSVIWVHQEDPKTVENMHVRYYSSETQMLVILNKGDELDPKKLAVEFAKHLKSKTKEEDKELKKFLKEYRINGQRGNWGLKCHNMKPDLYCRTIERFASLDLIKKYLNMGYRFCDHGPVDSESRLFTMVPTKYEWKRIEDLSLKHLINIVMCICDRDPIKYTDLKTVFDNKDMRNKLNQRIRDLSWIEGLSNPMWWVVENPSSELRGPYKCKETAILYHSSNGLNSLPPVAKRFKMVEVVDE